MNINLKKSILKKQINKYFSSIKKKNFEHLNKVLSKNAKLHDGNIIIVTRQNIINFTKKIFFNKKFRIYNQINLIDPKENIVFSRFFLKIDNNKLKIIDEIHFDKNQKIVKITVYKY